MLPPARPMEPRRFAWAQIDRWQSEIMLVENFR